ANEGSTSSSVCAARQAGPAPSSLRPTTADDKGFSPRRVTNTSSVGNARGTVTRTGRLNERGSPTSPVATANASVSAEATSGTFSPPTCGSGSTVLRASPARGGGYSVPAATRESGSTNRAPVATSSVSAPAPAS